MKKLLEKIDGLTPNPNYVDGVKQARPLTQIITFIIIATIAIYCYNHYTIEDFNNLLRTIPNGK